MYTFSFPCAEHTAVVALNNLAYPAGTLRPWLLFVLPLLCYVDLNSFRDWQAAKPKLINIYHKGNTNNRQRYKLFGSLLLIARYITKIVCIISENELEKPKTSILLCVNGGALQGMQDCSRQPLVCAPRAEKKMYT